MSRHIWLSVIVGTAIAPSAGCGNDSTSPWVKQDASAGDVSSGAAGAPHVDASGDHTEEGADAGAKGGAGGSAGNATGGAPGEGGSAGSGDGCFAWSGQPSLNDAVAAHACVEIQAGTWELADTLNVPSNREVRGLGYDQSVLVPAASMAHGVLVAMPGSSGVLVHRLRVRGDAGGRARLGVVIVGAGASNIVLDELMIDGIECDGLSMGGEGTVLSRSVLRNNGYDCPPVGTGSAIYAEGNVTIPGTQMSHAPRITDNLIEDNPLGTGIDMAEVSDGTIAHNTIRNNGANGGISIYHGHGWTIEYNEISNSGGWLNPGHPDCWGPHAPATVGIALCRDADIAGGTDNNLIRNNKSSGYYGILLAGAGETYLVPRNNTITDNDVFGSDVGCADDFQQGDWMDGLNTWTGNNCKGTSNTGPDYF